MLSEKEVNCATYGCALKSLSYSMEVSSSLSFCQTLLLVASVQKLNFIGLLNIIFRLSITLWFGHIALWKVLNSPYSTVGPFALNTKNSLIIVIIDHVFTHPLTLVSRGNFYGLLNEWEKPV